MRTAHPRQLLGLYLFAHLSIGCAGSGPFMRLHFIDVGQGDATLVELPCAAVLVDAGGEKNAEFSSESKLERYLRDFFARRADLGERLDLLLLTHAHVDHTRGVPLVLERYRPKNIVTNGLEVGSGRHQQIAAHRHEGARQEVVHASQVPAGGYTSPVVDPIECDSVDPELSVLWGQLDPAEEEKNGNNHSVVFRVGFGRATVLFTGDLETEMIERLIERHKARGVLDVDVYQVGHHGSANGTTLPLLEAMSPKLAVIGMGPHDRAHPWTAWAYGHPRRVVIEALEGKVTDVRASKRVWVASGVKQFEARQEERAIYATGWDGDVVLETDLAGRWEVVSLGR